METKVKKPLFALDKKKLQETGLSLLITLIALALALVVGALVIWAFGSNPIEAYGALWRGAFGTGIAFTVTLGKAVPVMLTGLAVAIAFRCSVFNIGAEGQLLIGAMCAALMGAYVHLPMVLHLPLTILASMVGGMIWAFFPAVLKLKGNVNVVISPVSDFLSDSGTLQRPRRISRHCHHRRDRAVARPAAQALCAEPGLRAGAGSRRGGLHHPEPHQPWLRDARGGLQP